MDWQEVVMWGVYVFTLIILIVGVIFSIFLFLLLLWFISPPLHREMILNDLEKRLDRMEEEKEKAPQ